METTTKAITADWATMGRKEFSELVDPKFAGVAVLPSAAVFAALRNGDRLQVVDDHDLATAYQIGDDGPVIQIAACCGEVIGQSADREEFGTERFSAEDVDKHHACPGS